MSVRLARHVTCQHTTQRCVPDGPGTHRARPVPHCCVMLLTCRRLTISVVLPSVPSGRPNRPVVLVAHWLLPPASGQCHVLFGADCGVWHEVGVLCLCVRINHLAVTVCILSVMVAIYAVCVYSHVYVSMVKITCLLCLCPGLYVDCVYSQVCMMIVSIV